LKDLGKNWPSVWVKMASSWVCVAVYVFTLFVPRCVPGRNFAYVEGVHLDDITTEVDGGTSVCIRSHVGSVFNAL